MNYVKYHVEKKDARRNNVKYHVKKSVKLKLEDQKCMAFHLPPLAKITSQLKYPVKKYFQLYYIYIIQSFSCRGLELLLTLQLLCQSCNTVSSVWYFQICISLKYNRNFC